MYYELPLLQSMWCHQLKSSTDSPPCWPRKRGESLAKDSFVPANVRYNLGLTTYVTISYSVVQPWNSTTTYYLIPTELRIIHLS